MMGRINVAALLGVTIALVANPGPAVSQTTCSNGIEGVESTSFDVCCSPECSTCGGPGCALQNTTNGAADCCVTEIEASGVLCDDSGAAPCIISGVAASNDSTCDNGLTGVQDPDTDVCCPLICGDACGGEGCGSIAGASSGDCCAADIMAAGVLCSDSGSAPCLITPEASNATSTCSNGLAGVEDTITGVCCVQACGQCGGVGCGTITGLSSSDCCSATIQATGEQCDVTGAAPCVLATPEFTPSTCPNGLAGVADGTVCCAEECNLQCGGEGCGSIAGTEGASDCCSATILASGVSCEQGVEAPCIMVNGSYTPAPAAVILPGQTSAPTPGSRGGMFSMAPTMLGQTQGPTAAGSRAFGTGVPSPAPTTVDDMLSTAMPSSVDGSRALETVSPTQTGTVAAPVEDGSESGDEPGNGAFTASASGVVTLAALVAGAFAMFSVSRN